MRNKKININILVVILVVGVLVWYLVPPTPEQVGETEQPAVEKQEKEEKSIITQSIGDYLASPAHADPAIIKRIQKIKRFQDLKTGEFNYFGKVIDQHGEPVIGAKITGSYSYYPLIPNGDFTSSSKGFERISDANGLFSILDKKGISIRIGLIEKEGYEFEKSRLYMFDRGGIKMLKEIGNPDKPVIFKAWKKTEAEHLVYSEGFYGFYKSGQPYTIDLYKEKKTEGVTIGDLAITFKRDPSGSRIRPSSWAVSVKVLGGGLVENQDVFMNEAPNEGYVPSWNISFKKGTLNYQPEIEKHFYLKSRGGNAYSKVKMRFLPYYKDGVDVIEIKAWLNPNGSQNLQYDPSKRIPLNK